MGTSVSNLQFLGVPEETVRAALPKTLVGRWSERFVTACPDMAFRSLERKGAFLSRKLACTLLSVSMFDGDTVSLVLFREGKRLTRHVFDLETGESVVGNPKVFCAGLGLPEELAPKLKRLFASCPSQEEKLSILQALLGAPLLIRYGDEEDGYLPQEPVKADSGPLEEWAREHPEPPKIKNQCRAELIQEIPEKLRAGSHYESNIILLRSPFRITEEDLKTYGTIFKIGEVIGECDDEVWARPLADGQLELVQLPQPGISPEQYRAFLHMDPPDVDVVYPDYRYMYHDGRLVITTNLWEKDLIGGGNCPAQTVVVHDTAGILPYPLPLTLDGGPAVTHDPLHLLPDGGFLAAVVPCFDTSVSPHVLMRESALIRYGPDGTRRWAFWGTGHVVKATAERVFVVSPDDYTPTYDSKQLLALSMDGEVIAQCPIPSSPYGTKVHMLGDIPYILEPLGYRKDDLLHRLTPDLRPDGEVLVPEMSRLAVSPDGTRLYAAGYESGMRVIDTASLSVLHELRQKSSFSCPVMDSQGRLWMRGNGCFECRTQELECISRHRLKGAITDIYLNNAGQVCAVTFQRKTYTIRVYRFS